MACFDMKKSRGCREAARNARAASLPVNYAASCPNGGCGFPFYCGPCGPATPTGGCTGRCPGSSAPQYALFTQLGSLNLEAGEAIPFNGDAPVMTWIVNDEGEITLTNEGVYLAALTVAVPQGQEVADRVAMELNGAPLPGGCVVINTLPPVEKQTAETFGAQAVFYAPAGSVLEAVSTEGLCLEGDTPSTQLATLTVVKLA